MLWLYRYLSPIHILIRFQIPKSQISIPNSHQFPKNIFPDPISSIPKSHWTLK